MSSGMKVTEDTLTPGIQKFPDAVADGLWKTTQYFAPNVESYARSNAPWTDRTGNARNGLVANEFRETGTNRMGIVLSHSMPYGIWLEIRFDGKNAIIIPTIKTMGKQYMQTLRQLLGKIPERH